MASMSVSGVVSGMDWDSMIDEIITNAAKPAQVKVNKKTNLTNKKSLFEEMKVTMNSLQSSLSPLKLPSTYKAKTIDIERIDTSGSYKGVLTATVNADAEVNVWDLKVNKLATAQVNRSKQITSSTLASTLNGLTSSTFYVNMGGQKVGIEVNATDTLQSLKSRINNTLKTLDNPLAVTASVVDNKLILKSDNTGLGTRTATETINYSTSGVNRLSNISVTKSDAKNLKITSGGKSYTYGTDFTVANGNEIRWKQYDRSTEVGLNDTVSVKYTMDKDDVYQVTGKYGSDEAAISGFNMIDNGTLSKRLYIRDDEDPTKTYEYGKDFTLDDNNKVVWIENPEVDNSPKYNEPDNYTVNLTKKIPVSVSKTYTKATSTDEPDTYTVSYTKTTNASYSTGDTAKTTATRTYTEEPDSYIVKYGDRASGSYEVKFTRGPSTTARDSISLNYTQLNEMYSQSTGDDLAFAPSVRNDTDFAYYLNPTDRSEFLMTSSSGTTYEYGVDYVIGTTSTDPSGSSATWQVIWGKTAGGSDTSSVVDYRGSVGGISGTSKPQPSAGTQFTFGVGYELDNNRIGRVDASDNDKLLTTVFGSDFDMAKFDSSKLTIRGYTYGTDYTVETDATSPNYGEIQWLDKTAIVPSMDDTINISGITSAYNDVYGTTEIPTVTLTDADGVLRTYLDPADTSAFTMTSGSNTYEYGKDYVIRVNDDRNGYVISWAITGDVNSDGNIDISDASTVVTTYTQYKELTTYGMKAAPGTTDTYSLAFSGSYISDGSATVNKSDADSSKNALNLLGLSSLSDADAITITDSDGTIRTDYTIDSTGKITWSGTNPTADDTFNDITLLQSAYSNTTGSSSIPRITLTDSDGVLRTYLDLADSDVNFQLSDASGKAYEYGRDYVIRVSDDGKDYMISWADANKDGTTDINNFNPIVAAYAAEKDIDTLNWRAAPTSGKFTFATTSTKTINLSGNVNSSQTDKSLAHVLNSTAITQADYASVVIPGYTQGKDYVINSEGTIRWLDQNSTTPEAYKATYTFSATTPSTTMFNIESTESVTRRFNNRSGTMPSLSDMGVKTFVGDKLIGSAKHYYVDEAEGKAAFTLTDSAGNTYEYGKDFAIRCASLTSTDLYLDMPTHGSWPSAFSNQTKTRTIPEGEMLTLTYNNTVTRFVDSEETTAAGLGFAPSDMSKLTLTDADGIAYVKDADYAIDSTGNVSWLEIPSYALTSYSAEYKFSDADSFSYKVEASAISASGQGNSFTRLQNISDIPTFTELRTSMDVVIGTSTLTAGERNAYITKEYGQAAFTLTTDSGKVLEYGKDYAIRSDVQEGSSTASTGLFVVYPNNSSWPWAETKNSSATRPTEGYTLSFSNTATGTSNGINSPRISQTLGFTPKTKENLTITSDGKTYTYTDGTLTGDTFTLDSSGYVKVASANHPTGSYTLVYEAFDPFQATDTVSDSSTQAANISAENFGHIDGDKLSYEQICSLAGTSSTITDQDTLDKSLAKYFTLSVDNDTNTYKYGTDYRIKKSDTTDSDSGEHVAVIEWISDGTKPAEGDSFTLTFTGGSGEVIETDGVKRSATDTITPTADTSTRPLYSKFQNATQVMIVGNGETFLLGTDFTVSEDGLGYAVINWIDNAPSGTPDYEAYFEDATSVTITNSSGETITDFTVEAGTNGEAVITKSDGTVLDAGNYTVKVVKGGKTRLYDLKSDGDASTLSGRSSWETQDNSKASTYTVYVTDSTGTTTFSGSRAAGSYNFSLNTALSYPKASDLEGHTTITQGAKTFYEGDDYIINSDSDGNAEIYWLNDRSGGTEWYYPASGTIYTINYTSDSGTTTTYTASRSASSTLDMAEYGLTTAGGSISVQYGDSSTSLSYKLDTEPDYDSDGNAVANTDGHTAIKAAYAIDLTGNNGAFTFNWVTPTLTSRTDLPSIGDELTVEYEYDANTFTITGDAAELLGLNDDVTEAQDAELEVDGELVYRASNDIGADYDNELIKGVTMHLKGTGEVSLDISHDAQKAVESIQTFVDTYNDLMTWMNTRMTEKEVDSDTKATIDSDDFRMRWGLLHGNSLLRSTKSQMRSLVSQNFTFSFTQRKSSSEIYGTMGYNGLRNSSTLRLRIGTKYVDVTIDPTDTLQTIVDKINDDTKGGPMNDIYYDDDGNKLQTPLLRVSADNDVLTINSTSSDEITMSGSAAMNALKMNYTYKGLYQLGIATTSDDYGKSGELEFDTDEFMSALEDNPDEVQELMLKFVAQFDTWTKSMLTSSASGETSGTLTREIENLQSQIDDINDYLETYQDRLDRMEEQLRTKYANTETSLSKLTQQASSIAAILNQLNGYSANNSSSSS